MASFRWEMMSCTDWSEDILLPRYTRQSMMNLVWLVSTSCST